VNAAELGIAAVLVGGAGVVWLGMVARWLVGRPGPRWM
jgi:hypothetical protein